jgi:hypothetical protein
MPGRGAGRDWKTGNPVRKMDFAGKYGLPERSIPTALPGSVGNFS